MFLLIRKKSIYKIRQKLNCSQRNMISFFFLSGVFCHLVVCQTLYEPILAKNTLLHEGVQAAIGTVFNTFERSLQNELKTSKQLAKNVQNLTSYLETTTIALMAFQQKFNVTDKIVLDICKIHPSLVLPHPFKCQQYYNCSMLKEDLIGRLCSPPLHFRECTYPDLFSIETLQCENFTDVKCGSRYEEKYYCNYDRNYVPCHPHTTGGTCNSDIPDCTNEPNGLHQDEMKGGAYYKICYKGRMMSTGYCQEIDAWETFMFPYNGKCVPSTEIPASVYNYHLHPSCIGKADGTYHFQLRLYDVYFSCKNGTAKKIKCKDVWHIDKDTGDCL